jgi:hypothetical protein
MKKFLLMILSSLLATAAQAETQWQSGPKKIPLIELYSSEGCSSCPPAEKWLAGLINNSDHFVKFTPINFHVDYWNKLGWIDRFSKSQFTERQKKYAASWGTGRIYTPAFVVDGVDRGAIGKSDFLNLKLSNEPGNLSVKKKGVKTFEISFDKSDKNRYEIYFAELANGLESKVTAGENDGKILTHNFVVLRLTISDLNEQKAIVTLADVDSTTPKLSGFAAWVTKKGSLLPVQSVGGTL